MIKSAKRLERDKQYQNNKIKPKHCCLSSTSCEYNKNGFCAVDDPHFSPTDLWLKVQNK
jgi:hypothetical protein